MFLPRRIPVVPGVVCWILLSLLAAVHAQSSTSSSRPSSSTPASTGSSSLSLTTSYFTITTTIQSGSVSIPLSTVLSTVYNVTVAANATPTSSASASASATSNPYVLDTHIDAAFGVVGAILIILGIPSAFLGHKNRWSSFFILGFYTLALVCLVLILKFGVLMAINPPSETLRGLFVLACGVAGIAGGGAAIFFWKATQYFIGAWGGFTLALWIQCFRDGGLISTIGYRWIMYIGFIVIGFVLCTLPKIHYHVLLVSTAFIGATSFMLGVDCYTTANLKEFYMWNLGFNTLFPKFNGTGIRFAVSQTMQIELGLIAAVALMGMAVQFQILRVLLKKLEEIKEAQRHRDEEAEDRAAQAFTDIEREKEEWSRLHPALTMHGRVESGSFSPFMKEEDHSGSDERHTLVGSPRQRYQSGVSDFLAAPAPKEDLERNAQNALQSPGALPVLDLGNDIEADVPRDYISILDEPRTSKAARASVADLEEIKRKEELLQEIQTIRKSLEILKTDSGTPDPSTSSESRRPSLTSKRTLSVDYLSVPPATHLRPPRQADPRGRVQSMGLSTLTRDEAVSRPTSVPLQEDWDQYVRDRKLLQPPSGVTAPIPTTPVSPTPAVPVSPAVAEALVKRQRRESSLSYGGIDQARRASVSSANMLDPLRIMQDYSAGSSRKDSSSDEIPVVLRARGQHRKTESQPNVQPPVSPPPVTILPPKHFNRPQSPELPQSRTYTFEELEERHRERLRQLQNPLTQQETEQAAIQEAKGRWERARAREKQQVTKRQAEKAAALNEAAKKGRPAAGDQDAPGRRSAARHSRALSADALAAVPVAAPPGKRMSMLKVEDWQKHQQGVGARPAAAEKAARRGSGVPFPDVPPADADYGRRRASMGTRDPVS